MTTEKRCSRCGLAKPADEFCLDKRNKSGLGSSCRPCEALRTRTKNVTNPEQRRTRNRRWELRHPEKHAEARHRRYMAHREERLAQMRAYRAADPDGYRTRHNVNQAKFVERNRERSRLWRQANPDRVRLLIERRRAWKQGARGDFTLSAWVALCDRYDNRCLACGIRPPLLTIDHVVPLRDGGAHDIGNVQPLCLECNLRKGTRVIDYRSRTDAMAGAPGPA